ncbi:hypothetical protein C7N43_34620 [Sphingobacteriales bacterium UPWRP_1]|nr:hypothetical protein C7N43_34620 [Sphingobacteriales bacterium UPWRP_1]
MENTIAQPLWVLVGLQTFLILAKIMYRSICIYRDYKNYTLNKKSAEAIIKSFEYEHKHPQS